LYQIDPLSFKFVSQRSLNVLKKYDIFDTNLKLKVMFGLVVCGGMEWNEKVYNKIPLFGCAKN
jgi:hypothetical protein